MKVLHTSDWHLGRSLYGHKRYKEFAAFLDWLVITIKTQKIDVLLIAGDVFDTSTPSNRAQELYYDFLFRVAKSNCKHVVVIAGNHDSPSFLNAPKQLLRALNVYVVGAITDDLSDEVIVLQTDDKPQAIICAVPYLRDKDIRTAEPGETIDDKNAKLIAGLKKHYADVCTIAQQKQSEFKSAGFGTVPIIAMGHLFTAGGQTIDGDGVRELYVGSLAHIGADVFPESIDYLALGHLHVPQLVGGIEHIRYSGSPIPMGFGEAKQQKKMVLIEFDDVVPNITELDVPCFQQLIRLAGSVDDIQSKLIELKAKNSSAWLEIEYTGKDIISNLRDVFDEIVSGSTMEIRRIKNPRVMNRIINSTENNETLDDLNTSDVFNRCLEIHEIPDASRIELKAAYDEIVKNLLEDDVNVQ